jgi:hypothetical protein
MQQSPQLKSLELLFLQVRMTRYMFLQIKSQVAAALIYTAWNLRKERNRSGRRTFDRVSASPARVFQLIREEIVK